MPSQAWRSQRGPSTPADVTLWGMLTHGHPALRGCCPGRGRGMDVVAGPSRKQGQRPSWQPGMLTRQRVPGPHRAVPGDAGQAEGPGPAQSCDRGHWPGREYWARTELYLGTRSHLAPPPTSPEMLGQSPLLWTVWPSFLSKRLPHACPSQCPEGASGSRVTRDAPAPRRGWGGSRDGWVGPRAEHGLTAAPEGLSGPAGPFLPQGLH